MHRLSTSPGEQLLLPQSIRDTLGNTSTMVRKYLHKFRHHYFNLRKLFYCVVRDILITYGKLLITFLLLYEAKGQEDADCPRGRCNDGRCPRSSYDVCPEHTCRTAVFGVGMYRNVYRRCSRSLLCLPPHMDCPPTPCTSYENACADGTCIIYLLPCRDGSIGCKRNERRCPDGSCAGNRSRCPGEPCPGQAPFACDNTCKKSSVVCDGVRHCISGVDEVNCTTPSDSGSDSGSVSESDSKSESESGSGFNGLTIFSFVLYSMTVMGLSICMILCVMKFKGKCYKWKSNCLTREDTTTSHGITNFSRERPRNARNGQNQTQQQSIWTTAFGQTNSGNQLPNSQHFMVYDPPPSYNDLPSVLPSVTLDMPPSYDELFAVVPAAPLERPPSYDELHSHLTNGAHTEMPHISN